MPENIKEFTRSRRAYALSFAWGLLEATVFFVVPDVMLGFIALFSPFGVIRHCAVSIAASVIGGSIMYGFTKINPSAVIGFLERIPGISMQMVTAVQAEMQHHGLATMLFAPWKGIPYKIYAAQAGALDINIFLFILMSVPARLERFFLVCFVAALLGAFCKQHIYKHYKTWIVSYILFWVLTYVAYALFLTIKH